MNVVVCDRCRSIIEKGQRRCTLSVEGLKRDEPATATLESDSTGIRLTGFFSTFSFGNAEITSTRTSFDLCHECAADVVDIVERTMPRMMLENQ